jgi:hypothetical protein
MSVTNTQKQYDAFKWKWRRCRDVIAGKDAIIQNGKTGERYIGTLFNPVYNTDIYLPRLVGQSDAEYLAYQERAGFFNATGRTLDALTGLIFAKDPQYELPIAIAPYANDVTLSDINLREFSEQVVEQQIAVGRVGIMVDYPQGLPSDLTVAAAEALNARPFLRWYSAEAIINWRTTIMNGARTLTLVVLREDVEEFEDEFTANTGVQYRVLDLTEQGYRVRVMDEDGALKSEVYPLMRGAPMRFIPFTILGANSADSDVQKPPLLDLVDTNLAHYRNSADYEHGLHFTGLPTPYVAGVQLDAGQVLSIGSTSAWVFPDPSAKAEFLEFRGDGLETLRNAIKDKEGRMAVLGARMLIDEKRAAEAYGTVELRTSGERSVLASISRAASDAIKRSLNWMAAWVGAPQSVEFALNTDFGATRMQPQMLTALVSAYQSDVMPLSVLFDNMQRGELVRTDMTFEQYEAQLDDQGPSLPMPGATDRNVFVVDDNNDDLDNQRETDLMAGIRERLGL